MIKKILLTGSTASLLLMLSIPIIAGASEVTGTLSSGSAASTPVPTPTGSSATTGTLTGGVGIGSTISGTVTGGSNNSGNSSSNNTISGSSGGGSGGGSFTPPSGSVLGISTVQNTAPGFPNAGIGSNGISIVSQWMIIAAIIIFATILILPINKNRKIFSRN